MPDAVKITFDVSELNRALAALNVVSDKLPSELVNQKGFFIFSRAAKNMKVVSKETITGELAQNATVAHDIVRLKSGKASRAKKLTKMFFGMGNIVEGQRESFSLMAAIVQSRATKKGKSFFKGKSKGEGIEAFQTAMRTVFNARIKSRGYFARCFGVAREVYRRANKLKSGKVFSTTDSFNVGSLMERRGKMADVTTAKEGQATALSTFWIKSTSRDTKDALDKYAAPVLQAAFDAEAEETFRHEAEEQYKAAIRALGIKVS